MVKRSDGRWQDSVKLPGMDKPKYFYGKTKAEIKRKISQWQEEKEAAVGFSQIADEWWEAHAVKLSYNTQKAYAPGYKRAKEHFGNTPIDTIKPVDISRMINSFARQGYAHKTVKSQQLVLSLICSFAVERGYCDMNATRDIKAPDKLPKKRVGAPSSEDLARVKANVNHPFGLFAYMALYTGLRCGELLALSWDDIDLEKRRIKVTKSVCFHGNKPELQKPKTEKSVGVVPILDALLPVLKAAKRKGYIFAEQGGGLLKQSRFIKLYRDYKKDTGVDATPHQFRHAYATMLFEAGVPAEKAQVLLRHAQIGTTMDIYRDIRADKLSSMFEDMYGLDIS